LPDPVEIESEEERAAREEDEIAALDVVGDYEADAAVYVFVRICICCIFSISLG
jgi:hypothetical protein